MSLGGNEGPPPRTTRRSGAARPPRSVAFGLDGPARDVSGAALHPRAGSLDSLRSVLPLLILALVATPLVEIAVISQMLVWAPWPLVAALVVMGTVTGLVVLRQDGLAHLQRWRSAHRRAAAADPATITEGLRDVAGVLLAVPGVVTTVVGLVLLAHPVRSLVAGAVVAGDRRRRSRRLPPIEIDTMPALPPAPPPQALEPMPGEDVEGGAWEALAFAGAPAGTGHIAGQTAAHDAVAETFFDAAGAPEPSGVAAPPPPPGSGAVPPAPPLPPVLPPPQAATTGDAWGEFMQGRGWEEAPERGRGRRRRRGGRASKPVTGGDE